MAVSEAAASYWVRPVTSTFSSVVADFERVHQHGGEPRPQPRPSHDARKRIVGRVGTGHARRREALERGARRRDHGGTRDAPELGEHRIEGTGGNVERVGVGGARRVPGRRKAGVGREQGCEAQGNMENLRIDESARGGSGMNEIETQSQFKRSLSQTRMVGQVRTAAPAAASPRGVRWHAAP